MICPHTNRCEAELREIAGRPDILAGAVPAWLVALAQLDWMAEMLLIKQEEAVEEGST